MFTALERHLDSCEALATRSTSYPIPNHAGAGADLQPFLKEGGGGGGPGEEGKFSYVL